MPRIRRKPEVHALYEMYSPRRLPRWRYDRLEGMLKRRPRREPVEGRDDASIVEAYPFLRRWRAFDRKEGSPQEIEELRREALFLDNIGLYYAMETFLSPQDDRTRAMIEAYILARLTDEQISARIALHPEHILWYERLFFNVRDRLTSCRYVMDIVLGSMVNQGVEAFNLGQSAKWFAYWAGADIADMIMDGYDKQTPVPGPEQDKAQFLYNLFASQCVSRAAASINSVELNNFSFKDFSEYSFRVQELTQKRAEEAGGTRSPLEDIASVMLHAVPWSVGSTRREVIADTPIASYVGHAAEPRVEELLAIANGNAPFDPGYLEKQKLPAPRERKDDEKTK